jgi:hypothetical protein
MCLFELCKYELRDGHGGRECQEFLVGDFLGDGVDLLLRLLFIGQRLDGCEGGANGHHQHVKAFLFRGGGLRGERRCVGIHGCLCVTSFVSTVHFNFFMAIRDRPLKEKGAPFSSFHTFRFST